eukprot:Nitzschia sp. Nitz4//NODE_611_length_9286_cov_71.495179//8346//9278//NITZ4_additional_000092-RA//1//CDS//3329532008//4223//frame0
MIVRERPCALALLLVVRGSVIPKIYPHMLALLVFTVAVNLLHHERIADLDRYSVAPFTLMGIAVSLFLGFRNNASYDRWWEGRKQWGQMVSDVRSLARSSATLLAFREDRERLLRLAAAHYHALRGQLRRQPEPVEVAEQINKIRGWLSSDSLVLMDVPSRNRSDCFLAMAGRELGDMYRAGKLDTHGVRILDEHLSRLAGIQAACERLAVTPLPFSYTLFTHRTAYMYLYLMPFGLVGSMGWITPIFTMVVAYAFFGLEALAQELELPFGEEPNHLPLDAMCRVNDISIAEALGDPVPEPWSLKGHLLT